MAEKKSQMLVRSEPADMARWKEAAAIRGVSLNQWLVDSANSRVVQSEVVGAAIEAFTGTSSITKSASGAVASDPLLAFDLALNETPTLIGQRKWVDPQALREVFVRFLDPEPEPTSAG